MVPNVGEVCTFELAGVCEGLNLPFPSAGARICCLFSNQIFTAMKGLNIFQLFVYCCPMILNIIFEVEIAIYTPYNLHHETPRTTFPLGVALRNGFCVTKHNSS